MEYSTFDEQLLLNSQDFINSRNYWQEHLLATAAIEHGLLFGNGKQKDAETFSFKLDNDVALKVLALCNRNELSVYIYMLTAYGILVNKYTGAEKVIIASPLFNQKFNDFPAAYNKLLPVICAVNDDNSFKKQLIVLRETVIGSFTHQHYPLHKVYARLNGALPGDKFDTVFVCDAIHVTGNADEDVPVVIKLNIDGNEISFDVSVAVDTPFSIQQFFEHFRGIIASDLNMLVKDMTLVSGAERQQLLRWSNAGDAAARPGFSLAGCLRHRLHSGGQDMAIVYRSNTITYDELNALVAALSALLQERELAKGSRVAVLLKRSEWTLVALLSLLQSGMVYVPLEVTHPAERIRFMLEDVQPAVIITEDDLDEVVQSFSFDKISISGITPSVDTTITLPVINDADEAYIIYTSGSTGEPKGVVITHGNLNHFFDHVQHEYLTAGPLTFPFLASGAFDISIFQLLTPIVSGGAVVITDHEELQDPDKLMTTLYKVTAIDTVPAVYNMIADHITLHDLANQFSHIRQVFIGGDKISDNLLHKLPQIFPAASVTVTYGPTEGTIFCTGITYAPGSINDNVKGSVIGQPATGSQVYVLGKSMQLLPAGVEGELCIGGNGVAKGYLKRPALTGEKFIANPVEIENTSGSENPYAIENHYGIEDPYRPGTMLYRTGDKARWTPQGMLEFRGRTDEQVKIRGHRIEPGEIEHCIRQHHAIADAVVAAIAIEDSPGRHLAAWYVLKPSHAQDFSVAHLQQHLRQRLPDYMMPNYFMALEKLPLTANNKINKKALPHPHLNGQPHDKHTTPTTQTERQLVQVWQELLRVQQVGITDNFFELGGDSIMAIQAVSRARRLGLMMEPRDIFRHQSIRELASVLSVRQISGYAVTGEQGLLSGDVGLLPVQQSFFHDEQPHISHFNQSLLISISKQVTAAELDQAVHALMNHHDALRLKFTRHANGWEQEYTTNIQALIVEDLSASATENLSTLIEERAGYHQRSLNIEEGQLMRAVLMQTPDSAHWNRLLLIVHHLAVDGVSWRMLMEDLELLLQKIKQGERAVTGTKTSSYRDWYNALVEYAASRALRAQLDYWIKIAKQFQPLPVDKGFSGPTHHKDIVVTTARLNSAQTAQLLQEAPRAYHTEINDLLLAALAKTLANWTGMNKFVIGLEGHGREQLTKEIDTSRTIGWFTTMFPVLLEVQPHTGEQDLITNTKEQLRNIPAKGLGYGVLKYINNETSLQGREPWEVLFNYLGQLDNVINNSEWFAGANEFAGDSISPLNTVNEKLSINCFIQGGELVARWSYSNLQYEASTIDKLASEYIFQLGSLIDHCAKKESAAFTSSDYGLGPDVTNQQLDQFLQEEMNGTPRKDIIEDIYRLSSLQEGMLFHALYDEQAAAYVEQFACGLLQVQEDALMKSWDYLARKHSILRSAFYLDTFNIPVQCVYRYVTIPVEILDWRNKTEQQQSAAIHDYETAERLKGFDLKEAPLMRIALLRLSNEAYRMVWTSHHVLTDGWSLPVLLKELLMAYENILSGHEPMPVEQDKYGDYIRYIQGRNRYEEERYWRKYLQGITESTLLPFVVPVTERNKGIGEYKVHTLQLDKVFTSKIAAFAQQSHVTVNTIMQGVWSYLLYRYTGNSNVLYGVTVSGRPEELAGVESRVGMYINTLPFCARVNDESLVTLWLQSIQEEQAGSREYQYTSLNDIQQWIERPGDLFDTLMVFENYPVGDVVSSFDSKLKVTNVQVHEQVNYPLGVVIEVREEISIRFTYNTQLLQHMYVEQVAGHFAEVLDQLTQANSIRDIELLTHSEREQVLNEFNHAPAGITYKTVVELFEECVHASPHQLAVVCGEQQLTYLELNERSNRVAHLLQAAGIRPEALVAVCIDRSVELIISILGVLKAGAAYVPVDPGYPAERIAWMLEDTAASIVLSAPGLAAKMPAQTKPVIISLDDPASPINQQVRHEIHTRPALGHLAYVIYTSGSTGKPKGVMIEHRSLSNLINWHNAAYHVTTESKATLVASVGFDASVWETWPYLCAGACLFIVKRIQDIEASELLELYCRHGITHSFLPTALVSAFADACRHKQLPLQYLLTGGDALNGLNMEGLNFKLINNYGPTENTVVATCYNMQGHNKSIPPFIGKPITNTTAYILHGPGQLNPAGITGEIYIGGVQLARGYLNQPELTEEKFKQDPAINARLYRTGDAGRWMPDGNIEYAGRVDHQLKIRGFRIEAGEIESVLLQTGLVSQAVVIAKKINDNSAQLVCYVVTAPAYEKEELIQQLRKQLPDYMVPALFIEMGSLPMTPSGKIDRKALPDPDNSKRSGAAYVAPRNELEEQLATIWQQLLGVQTVGVYDNFFELGGHSLLATRLRSAIKTTLSLILPIRVLFELNTINDLAKYLELELAQVTEDDHSAFEVIDL